MNSSNKQRETTIHHYFHNSQYGKFEELRKFLQGLSQTPSSVVMKLTLSMTGRPRVTSAAEDKFIRVTSLRNCSLWCG
jgi:hypothetical protein